jgi:bifunctional non-homologous end joining protein LigD
MKFNSLPAGFIVPAQPVLASKPPSGADWVHEIKHDGYRMIVRRNGPSVRLYSRNAYDWTPRLAAIAATAQGIKAKSSTIDGEAVVLGLDGLSVFDELRRREATDTAILYAFDLIERDGEDMRNLSFLRRKAALARLLRNTEAGILFNEHIAQDGPSVFAHACRLGAEGIVSKRIDSTYRSGSCRVWIKVRNPANMPCSGRERELESTSLGWWAPPMSRSLPVPVTGGFKHSSPFDGIQTSVISYQDFLRPAQGFLGAGHEADGDTAMTRCKGEITRGAR